MLKAYGLNEDVLALAFKEAQNEDTLQWYVKGVPNADFYRALHPFFKKWHITRNATKVTITLKLIQILLERAVVQTMSIDLLISFQNLNLYLLTS